tara:strand:- start:3110 stop:4294 length:1185 start_codon:yes stop_codon:yes gene_type:complete
MIFQTLDDKESCVASYYDGTLHFDEVPTDASATWNYHTYLPENIKFAELYAAGKTAEQMCPEELQKDWDEVTSRLKGMLRSFYHVGLTPGNFCFYELVPHRFLKQHAELKNKITEHVLNTCDRPQNYEHMVQVERLAKSMSVTPIKLNPSNVRLQMATQKGRDLYRKYQGDPTIQYNQFGTRTGRLTTRTNSFPILTLPKKMRAIIEPYKNAFLEFDVVSAEVATLFYLAGHPVPEGDLHEWINENAFKGKLTREKCKTRFFAWLYDPRKKNTKLEKLFNRRKIFEKYYNKGKITNPLGRTIEVGEEKALNYLVQSTFNDIFLHNIARLSTAMKEWGMKSNVAFVIHDSVVLDFDAKERDKIEDIKKILSSYDTCNFGLHMNVGKNYGNMKEVE